MATTDLQNRAPAVSRTRDFRNIVERRYDVLNWAVKTPAEILAECWQPLGTTDELFTDCYLLDQKVEGQTGDFYDPCKFPPVLVRRYEQLNGLLETLIGEPSVTINQFGHQEIEFNYAQLASGTATYSVPGVSVGPSPFSNCVLRDQVDTNDGTLRLIKRTYLSAGVLSNTEELRFGGKLKIRTIRSLNEIPATPSGYTLVTTGTEYTEGLPIFVYGFAAAGGGDGTGGVISQEIEYIQSSDTGTTGVTITTIRYLTDLTIDTNPITPPAGTVLVSIDYEDEAGFRQWTGKFAKGTGEVARSISYGQSINEGTIGTTTYDITHLTASTISSNPISTPSGTVLIAIDHSESNGWRVWRGRYSKGTGLVLDESTIIESAALVTYHRVALGAAPSAPAATIGGTVTLFEDSVTNSDGYQIFSRRWAEGDGQSSISTQGQSDGALIYTVVTQSAAASTPAYPGSGTAYLVALDQKADGGYFTNRATYHKPPATVTLSQQTNFENPGTAAFTGSPPQLVITQQVTQTILADMEVSYDTSQVTDTPFSVEAYAALYYTYVPTDTGIAVQAQQALGGCLAGASSISGTGVFNGVDCSAYEAVLVSSIPSAFPGGVLVLHVDNEIYLTAIDGTVVFRRKKVSYDFS